jgi:hypothetical protein
MAQCRVGGRGPSCHRKGLRCDGDRPWQHRHGPPRLLRRLGLLDRFPGPQLRSARLDAGDPHLVDDPVPEPQRIGMGPGLGRGVCIDVHLRSCRCSVLGGEYNPRPHLRRIRATEPGRSSGGCRCGRILPLLARCAGLLAAPHPRSAPVPRWEPAVARVAMGGVVEHHRNHGCHTGHGRRTKPVEHVANRLGQRDRPRRPGQHQ